MSARTAAAGVLAVVASLVLVLCIFLSWYTVSETTSSGSQTYSADFYPGQKVTLSEVSGGSTVTYSTNYSAARLNNTGNLYLTVEVLLILSAFLGIVGGGLLIAASTRPRPGTFLATFLVSLGIVMAILGPVLLVAYQPTALSDDSYNAGSTSNSGPGPTSSFFGSESVSGGAASWGPGLGWYLSIVVFALLIVSVAIVPSPARKELASTEEPVQASGPGYGAYSAGPPQFAPPPPPAHSGYPQYAPSVPSPQLPYSQPPNPVATPRPPPTSPTSPTPQPAAPDERYCPACGMGNFRSSLYCEKCGRPLPPPR